MKKLKYLLVAVITFMIMLNVNAADVNAPFIGDIDGDGYVTVDDSEIIKDKLSDATKMFSDLELLLADANYDGIVNWVDSEYIRLFDTGEIECIPTEYRACDIALITMPLFGDLDEDGDIDEDDQAYIENDIMTEKQRLLADVDLSGTVDAGDIMELKNYINGDLDVLPANRSFVTLKRGDINKDGKITKEDAQLALEYSVGKTKLTQEQQILANVDLDSDVDAHDALLILQYEIGKLKKLPIGNNPYLNTDNNDADDLIYKFGDVNFDGKINVDDVKLILKYLKGEEKLTEIQKVLADVNVDGVVDEVDALLILGYYDGKHNNLPTSDVPVLKFGDVNKDGKVDDKDIKMIEDAIAGKIDLDEVEEILADVNLDDKVDKKDLEILKKHIAGEKGYEKLPYIEYNDNVPSPETGDIHLWLIIGAAAICGVAGFVSYRKFKQVKSN